MRMKKHPSPREALLVEIIEPSKVIEEKFRTHVVTLVDGRQLAGIIVENEKNQIRIAADPAHLTTFERFRESRSNKSSRPTFP